MPETSPDGLRYPVDSDSPDVPRDFKNLAEDVQAALVGRDAQIARSSASSVRPGSASSGAGTWVPVAAEVRITAPAGLYLISVTATGARQGGVGAPLQLSIVVNGATQYERTVAETADDYTRPMNAAVLYSHAAAGVLAVTASGRAVGASFVVHAGSRIDVARISI